MSKSEENPQGVISMFDSPEVIIKKIMKATTDSDNTIKYDPENKPGISNLLNIASVITGLTIEELEKQFENRGYGDFKKYVASVTATHISVIQERYNQLIENEELDNILDKGIQKSRELAKEKYNLMKTKMGVTRKDINKL